MGIDDQEHTDAHQSAEYEVREVLASYFPQDRACRAHSALNVLAGEFLVLDEVEDVADITSLLAQLIMERVLRDREMLQFAGSS